MFAPPSECKPAVRGCAAPPGRRSAISFRKGESSNPSNASALSKARNAALNESSGLPNWPGYFMKALAHGTPAVVLQRMAPVFTKVQCDPFTAEGFAAALSAQIGARSLVACIS